jgi:hypothetical protein
MCPGTYSRRNSTSEYQGLEAIVDIVTMDGEYLAPDLTASKPIFIFPIVDSEEEKGMPRDEFRLYRISYPVLLFSNNELNI